MEESEAKPHEKKAGGKVEPLLRREEGLVEEPEEVHFIHPMQFSTENTEAFDEKGSEGSRVEIEPKLQELFGNITQETLRLSEFLREEEKLMKEICLALKQIMRRLNVSFNIHPRNIPARRRVNKVILNEEGCLILVNEKGDVNSAFLGEYPPEIVKAVLWVTMPELVKAIVQYRKRVRTRVTFFGRVKKELNNAVKAIIGSEGKASKTNEEETTDSPEEGVNAQRLEG